MGQNFVACDREQELLLPPSLREWLPEGAPCVVGRSRAKRVHREIVVLLPSRTPIRQSLEHRSLSADRFQQARKPPVTLT